MREKILRLLRQEGHISGESIARELHISRAAVWKHILMLRKKGYQISSAPRRGYYLIKDTDSIVPEAIMLDLGTQIMGKRVLYYDELGSTQDMAEKLARNGEEEGVVVIGGKQTRGRGRRGRGWLSPAEGGVYFSLILRTHLRPVNMLQIPMLIGVALVRAIRAITGLPANIKWPNDIHIGNRKVAGILTEINCEVDRVNYIIPGIGINVNTQSASIKTANNLATSLAEELGAEVSRVQLIRRILVELEEVYLEFVHSGPTVLLQEWKGLNNTLGSRVKITDENMEINGRAVDLDPDGFLLVQDDSGNLHKIVSGDVSLRTQPE